jgi:hypothetical protein
VNAFVGSYDTSTDEVRFRTEPVLNGQILDSDGEFISLSKLAKDPWAAEIAAEDEDDNPELREELTGILMRRFESVREGSARAVASYKKQGLKTAADFLNRPAKVITLRDLHRSTWDSEKAKGVYISFFKEHKTAPEFDEGGNVIQLAKKATEVDWRTQFATVGQLETGGVKMLVEGFLPEGISMLGALPGVGKTWFALSLAKALTTATPFLGRFEVKEIIPVLYLIPESSGGAFRARAEKFKIPNDPKLFLCRTVSQGSTLQMSDPAVLAAVKELRPVVILDTAIRFNRGSDENSANSNKIFVDDSVALRAAGARGIFGLHHATKNSRNEGLTQENSLRGSGDLAAMCDSVYGLKRNEALYDDGSGPLQLQVICLKPREFEAPEPFTIAASMKDDDGKTISYIDTTGDFALLNVAELMQDLNGQFVKAVTEDPTLSIGEVAELLSIKKRRAQTISQRLGYKKRKGLWTARTTIDLTGKAPEVDI